MVPKDHHAAKLDYDLDRINQCRKELIDYLRSEYGKMNMDTLRSLLNTQAL